MPILELKKLTVRFGGLTAVNAFDCAVEAGQIFSVIGPNGAGKTTVFNAITGIYEPAEGCVVFEGRELRRPFTWKVAVACLLIGLATAKGALLAAVNVNQLWRASIKRNFNGDEPFSYSRALGDAWDYLRGDLAAERSRSGRWSIVTFDGSHSLGHAANAQEAAQLRDELQSIVDHPFAETEVNEVDGRWAISNRDAAKDRVVSSFTTRELADAALESYAEVGRKAAAHRRRAWLALLGGFAVGAAGTYAVWNRSRRTPEVIAQAGIARTFQNIRLFQNMTVLENVLTAMDRRLHAGAIRGALRTPSVRREEAAAAASAVELLKFVGLDQKADSVAKNLPYGDQRRLEIARALATEPRLILLDEPAAGMNPAESADLTRLIQRIHERGVTVMLIEHHMRVVMDISDRIAVLDYGVKIAEGTPEQVRANPEVIEAYLGSEEVT